MTRVLIGWIAIGVALGGFAATLGCAHKSASEAGASPSAPAVEAQAVKALSNASDAPARVSGEALIREAHAIVAERFYSPARLKEVDWPARLDEALASARSAVARGESEKAAAADAIRAMIARLGASHTALYTRDQREWYDLMDIFRESPALAPEARRLFPPEGRIVVPSVGIVVATIPGEGRFAVEVMPGSPAAEAKIGAGDRIILAGESADDLSARASLLDALGDGSAPVFVRKQRGRDGPLEEVQLRARLVNPGEEHLEYMTRSARVIEFSRVNVACVRLYSGAGEEPIERLRELLTEGPLASADALVLDIRGGWGGVSQSVLSLFDRAVPTFTHITRDGERREFRSTWTKPVALLIDGGSRSSKEAIAYAFKKAKMGPLVGARTAGAVLGGRPFLLKDDSLLYVAVSDALVDGERLEGAGVRPNVEVARPLAYALGSDPQLDAAVQVAASEALKERAGARENASPAASPAPMRK